MASPVAKLQSPLDSAVDAIKVNPEYLTQKHAIELVYLLKVKYPDLPEFAKPKASDGAGQTNVLKDQLERMGDALSRLLTSANNGESADFKRLFDAQKEYFKLLAKFNSALEANDRLNVIENATHQALSELGNKDLTNHFMVLLREKLIESDRNRALNG